ncbi:hypothetical protein ZWY2020_055419 [Hordeum vulgare]|nr:hypothetical protein ZWY2020_055419 [Hordeum vulgare]
MYLNRAGLLELHASGVTLSEPTGCSPEKTCEMGTAYETLRAEKIQFAGERDATLLAMAAADVEWSIRENVPLGEDANRDLLAAHIRVGKVGPFIGRLREIVGRIDKELWPEDESRQEMENLMSRLEEVPNQVQSWKKSARRGAMLLILVECIVRRCEEKLKALKVANEETSIQDFMETFLESATRIADGID